MNNRDRPTIAFLTRSFSADLIGHEIWCGIHDAARAGDVNLLSLPGNPPHSNLGFEFMANVLYDMVDRTTIDGLLVWGGAMVGMSPLEDTLALYRRFADFPMVNISLKLPGIPSLMIDNYLGMFSICSHLIERHGCRRIAFIRGPEDHPESNERFRAYCDALAKHGLTLDPGLTAIGNFLRVSGRAGMKRIMSGGRADFDAVIGANDLMALGAGDELLQAGVLIPDQVKLAGFDDITESRYFRTPLTTVHQPFYEMGSVAVKQLTSLIRGEPITADLLLPPEFIARQSCGCPPTGIDRDSVGPATSEPAEEPAHDGDFKERLILRLAGEAAGGDPAASRLAGPLAEELFRGKNDAFLIALDRDLLVLEDPQAISRFHDSLSALRRAALPLLRSDVDRLITTETLLHRARIMIGEYLEKSRAAEMFRNSSIAESSNNLNRIMISTYQFDDFTEIMAREFPLFDIPSYYFCMYENPAVPLDVSRLLIAYRDKERIPLPDGGLLFPTRNILPEQLLPAGRQLSLIVKPLYFRGGQLGYIVFEDDRKVNVLYEELRSHLSVALSGTLLFQEKERLLAEREEQARHLQETSAGLERSNAELEQFTYIVSHDLQEPLRKIAVFADRLRGLCAGTNGSESLAYIERMQKAGERMRQLINDLLAYSRLSRNAAPFRRVDLNQSVRAVLQDLELRIEQEQAAFEISPLPVLEAEPRHLEQLLQNLISNALKFRQLGRPLLIKIGSRPLLVAERPSCELAIEDNGIGIDPKHFNELFKLFHRLQTTSEIDGTGIGLAICKKVAEGHHGRIRVESVPGRGTSFFVTLPLTQPRAAGAAEPSPVPPLGGACDI